MGQWGTTHTCYIGNSQVCLKRPRIVFQVDMTDKKSDTVLRMKQEAGVGEAAFLVVPGVATRWRACLSHRLSLTCQMTRSLFQMSTEQLQQKDQQILLLLEEKETIFRDMTECSTLLPEDCSPTHSCRTLFRSNTEEALKGGPLMKSAINEGNLHSASPTPPPHSGLHVSIIYH